MLISLELSIVSHSFEDASLFFTIVRLGFSNLNPGNHDRGETPVPIPNTEAKPSGADGTARGAEWESRKLPGFLFFSEKQEGQVLN